jgi:hypothetical protein
MLLDECFKSGRNFATVNRQSLKDFVAPIVLEA